MAGDSQHLPPGTFAHSSPASDAPVDRLPWVAPHVIVSKAHRTQKTPNTLETTVGPLHFGPS